MKNTLVTTLSSLRETQPKVFNNKTKAQNTERTNIISEIDALNKRYQNALLKNTDGEMAHDIDPLAQIPPLLLSNRITANYTVKKNGTSLSFLDLSHKVISLI